MGVLAAGVEQLSGVAAPKLLEESLVLGLDRLKRVQPLVDRDEKRILLPAFQKAIGLVRIQLLEERIVLVLILPLMWNHRIGNDKSAHKRIGIGYPCLGILIVF